MSDKNPAIVILVRQIQLMVNETSVAISNYPNHGNVCFVGGCEEEVKTETLALIKRLEPLLNEAKKLASEA